MLQRKRSVPFRRAAYVGGGINMRPTRKRSSVLNFLFRLFRPCCCPRSMNVTMHSADDTTRLRHGYGGQVGRWSRRAFLARNALGLGSVALAWLLREDNL